MIKKLNVSDFKEIYEIINDGASAYKGIIPIDRWKEPYMSEGELWKQIEEGVEFWGYFEDGVIEGVMGYQDKHNVTLIRHAYIRTSLRKKGIGTKLLLHLLGMSEKPVLIGTWEAATWAISFYIKHGFRILEKDETNSLLKKYWNVPDRQIETSVVLADKVWKSL